MVSTVLIYKVSRANAIACCSQMIGVSDLTPYISKFIEAKVLMACNLFPPN